MTVLAPARLPTDLLLLERERRRRAAVGTTRALAVGYGAWIARARPEHDWTAPHFLAMQRLLDDVTVRRVRRAYVQIPIRHGKTEHNTVGYAVARLEDDPRTRVLVGSYNQRQAEKFSREIRRLARARGVALSGERDAAGEWETTAGGGVRAVGAGAGVASVNADVILVDDPLGSRDDAESPAKREQVWDWITNDLLARAEPHTVVLLTMSRWHQDDPGGRIRDGRAGPWTVLDLPAEAEPDDPLGRVEGAPLWPALRDAAWLAEKRLELGAYGFASLLQGRPRPREGGMFRWPWWGLLEVAPTTYAAPLVRYWDLAGSTPKGGSHDPDYSAGVLGGRLADQRTVILDVVRFRHTVGRRDAELVAQARADVAAYGTRPGVRWWIETEAGIAGEERTAAIVRAVQAVGVTVHTERPSGSKVVRAEPLASAAEAGNVLLGPETPDRPWRDAFRAECADFPTGLHDDQIDSAAGMYAKLSAPPPVPFTQPARDPGRFGRVAYRG